jgi:hypothetical protein
MMRIHAKVCFSVLLALLASANMGCSVPNLSGNPDMNASVDGGLSPPSVSVATTTGSPTIAVRGLSPGADDVVVETATSSVVARVTPDSAFCADVPLIQGVPNDLKIIAVANGIKSAPTLVRVLQSPGAPIPADYSCLTMGSGTPNCAATGAACDPQCNGCKVDYFSPNYSPQLAPNLPLSSTLNNLQYCPCRPAWFSVVLDNSQAFGITAYYAPTPGFDLELALFAASDLFSPDAGADPVPLVVSDPGTSGSQATATLRIVALTGAGFYLRIAPKASHDNFCNGSCSSLNGKYTLVVQ